MLSIKAIHNLYTKYAADSIEWCPHSNYNKYFVCGTYELEKSESPAKVGNRKGCICLYKFDKNSKLLEYTECLETAAILDIKWWIQPTTTVSQPILGVANALGQISIYQLNTTNHLQEITSLSLHQDNTNCLALSLDWSDLDASSLRLLSSDSNGVVHLLRLSTERTTLSKENSWKAHDYEAWVCTFDKWNRNVFYSGGDDTFLNVYDLRTSNCVLRNKCHNAGVTSLLSHSQCEHILLTGSYDDCFRIFDIRAMKHQLFEVNLAGGVWRLKSDPLNGNLILAACMYNNFSVLDIKNATITPCVVGEFNEHTSICYGADWCKDVHPFANQLFMATCSFYDHKLCISEVQIK